MGWPCVLHVHFVATERCPLRQLLLHHVHDSILIRDSQPDFLCVYSLIGERFADGIQRLKHGVIPFVIKFLENHYHSATCSNLEDRVTAVLDSTELIIWPSRISSSRFTQQNIKHILPGMAFWPHCWSLIGRGSCTKQRSPGDDRVQFQDQNPSTHLFATPTTRE